jgi:SAM-dependent methyltransferase
MERTELNLMQMLTLKNLNRGLPQKAPLRQMRTDSKRYSDYLEAKYLPGRRLYLQWVFYPKLLRRLGETGTIFDLGCGTGEFLNFCRKRRRKATGVDSNEILAEKCRQQGFDVLVDNICQISTLSNASVNRAICDNVLEHLDLAELRLFFRRLNCLLAPGGVLICVVPGVRGFKCDPTHKTFVCYELLSDLLRVASLRIKRRYYHPLNIPRVDRAWYLNMQVFEIEKPEGTRA